MQPAEFIELYTNELNQLFAGTDIKNIDLCTAIVKHCLDKFQITDIGLNSDQDQILNARFEGMLTHSDNAMAPKLANILSSVMQRCILLAELQFAQQNTAPDAGSTSVVALPSIIELTQQVEKQQKTLLAEVTSKTASPVNTVSPIPKRPMQASTASAKPTQLPPQSATIATPQPKSPISAHKISDSIQASFLAPSHTRPTAIPEPKSTKTPRNVRTTML